MKNMTKLIADHYADICFTFFDSGPEIVEKYKADFVNEGNNYRVKIISEAISEDDVQEWLNELFESIEKSKHPFMTRAQYDNWCAYSVAVKIFLSSYSAEWHKRIPLSPELSAWERNINALHIFQETGSMFKKQDHP